VARENYLKKRETKQSKNKYIKLSRVQKNQNKKENYETSTKKK